MVEKKTFLMTLFDPLKTNELFTAQQPEQQAWLPVEWIFSKQQHGYIMMNENNEAVTVSDSQMPKLITLNPLAEEEKLPVVPKRREVQGLGFIAPQKA